jgi:hypothetical protein
MPASAFVASRIMPASLPTSTGLMGEPSSGLLDCHRMAPLRASARSRVRWSAAMTWSLSLSIAAPNQAVLFRMPPSSQTRAPFASYTLRLDISAGSALPVQATSRVFETQPSPPTAPAELRRTRTSWATAGLRWPTMSDMRASQWAIGQPVVGSTKGPASDTADRGSRLSRAMPTRNEGFMG